MNNKLKATAMDSVTELSPKIKRGRSTFNLQIREYTSFNVGDLVPISWTEVLPGDTFNVNLNSFIRLTSPSKRPTMDNLHMDVYAFFVPYRFVDASWVNIQGENAQAWVAPAASCSTLKFSAAVSIAPGSLLNHLGLPVLSAGSLTDVQINIYPVYSYMKLVNDWFRDENLQNELAFDNTNNTYNVATIPSINSTTVNNVGSLFKVAKYHDVFTSALPFPQKSANPVTLPLGKFAPVVGYNESATDNWNNPTTISVDNTIPPVSGGVEHWAYIMGTGDDGGTGPLLADLSSASAATINELRLAFQLQKAYELDARSGTRYTEALEARFGTRNPDLRLGRSELLGHYRFDLNMAELASTTNLGATGSSITALKGDSYLNGVGAGSSKTGNSQHICVKSFLEHGIFMIVGCVRPDLTYQQGIEKFWNKKSRFDFYEPIFSNIGEVPIMKSELYGAAITADSVFGYQEAWYEYRYHQNHISGVLSSASSQSFDIFHYGLDLPSAPTLSSAFIQQSSAAVDRTLLFGSSSVDNFIANFQGVIKATRVMPLFSTPGLIDHF